MPFFDGLILVVRDAILTRVEYTAVAEMWIGLKQRRSSSVEIIS